MSYTKVDKNKYRIFISDGSSLDGKRKRHSKTITTDLKGWDLKKYLDKVEVDFEEEIKKRDPKFHLLTKGTFKEYSIWWISYKKISDKTRETYQFFLDVRILPNIGDKTLDKLTTGDMLELMKIIETTPSNQTKKLLSTKTIKHHHTLLKTMFNDAVFLKILSENPMTGVPVKSPKAQLKDNYYDTEDINKLFAVLPEAPTKYQLAVLLGVSTGLRLGELSALQWKHININECYLLVEQSNSHTTSNGSKIKETKTENTRKVTFPKYLLELLELHKKDEIEKKELLGDKWFYEENKHEDDYVFTQKNGKMIFVDTISSWFIRFIEKHNLKRITFHGLRHTSTTMLITSGINVKNISARLGHSRTSTTTDFYAHALESVDQEAANIFNTMFSKEDDLQSNMQSGSESGSEEEYLKIVK